MIIKKNVNTIGASLIFGGILALIELRSINMKLKKEFIKKDAEDDEKRKYIKKRIIENDKEFEAITKEVLESQKETIHIVNKIRKDLT